MLLIGPVVFGLIVACAPGLAGEIDGPVLPGRDHNGYNRSSATPDFAGDAQCTCHSVPCPLASAPTSCLWNRTVPRTDCPCCTVCARQSSQSCDSQLLPCDEQLGLECDAGTCAGPFRLQAAEVTHNSTVLQWTFPIAGESSDRVSSNLSLSVARRLDAANESEWSPININRSMTLEGNATVDGLSPDSTYFMRLSDGRRRFEVTVMQTKVGCVENGTSFGVGERYDIGCSKRCECTGEGVASCSDVCKTHPAGDSCRDAGPDPRNSCCRIFICDVDSVADGRAHVILTGRTPNSLTFAWDDFKAPGPRFDNVYIVEYRHFSNGSSSSPWNKVQVGDIPITTLRNLEPNSPYEVRVSIWEDVASKGLGPSAEVTILYTEDGCIQRNRTVAVNAIYDVDCNARCRCLGNNASECGSRCVGLFVQKGAAAGSDCSEVVLDSDPCCVLVECAKNRSHDRRMDSSDEGHSGGLECPVLVTDTTGECRSTCESDKECEDGNKCCLAECGNSVCVAVGEVVDECADVRCGPNSRCRVSQNVTLCHCIPGYAGVPFDASRVSGNCEPILQSTKVKTAKAGCTFGNATYLVGETFNNGCEYKCRCNNDDGKYEMSCQPRCSHKQDKSRLFDPACHLRRDPDDECCKVLVCETVSENDAERTAGPGNNSSHKISGCVFKGKAYEAEERFYDGCEHSCRCLGTGKVNCHPRCPTRASVTPGCTFVASSQDELCCSIVLCNSTRNGTAEGFIAEGEGNTTIVSSDTDSTDANGDFLVTDEMEDSATVVWKADPNDTDVYAVGERSARGNATGSTVELTMLMQAVEVANTSAAFSSGAILGNMAGGVDFENGTSSVAPSAEVTSGVSERGSRLEGHQVATIYKILPINPTTVRLQIVMSPAIMEKMFMDGDAVAVLYTSNLTTDLIHWDAHPLALQHNVAFVSVDRSDIAVETIVTELHPNREYYFVVVMLKEGSDPDEGLRYEKLGEVQATITVQLEESVCEFMGKTFRMGERLYDDCQAMCDCLPGRHVHCEAIVCPNQLSPEKSGCLEWYVDQSFISRAPHCCPDVTCKYGSTCVFEGHKFHNLETIPRFLVEECDQVCKCVAGNVTCTARCPSLAQEPPKDLGCEPSLSLLPGDDCCLHWFCEKEVVNGTESTLSNFPMPSVASASVDSDNVTFVGNNTTASLGAVSIDDAERHDEQNVSTSTAAEMIPLLAQSECTYESETYRVNDQWRVGKGHRQKTCTCVLLRNGSSSVECQGGCPPILKQQLGLIPDCPPENVVVWDVPELCPYVVCNKTDVGRGVKNVSVETLNSTSVRIGFIIPSIYVGLYGHIEILYTMDLTHSEDTTTWSKEVFSGPSNQFENARLGHEMNGLQPDTEYYLKVRVIVKNTKNMETSDIVTVHTPPLPTTASTTTTLPPKIFIDPQLNVSDVQSTSAKVSWRSFDESERRFVDGVQLQFRPQTDSATHQWSQTALIHRDVTMFVLDHLKPDENYETVLIFVPPANVSTEVLPEKAVSFHTLPMRDDFEFNLTLTVDRVSSHTVDLIWTGVPYPEQKYVNVYRMLYLEFPRHEGVEPSYLYRAPKGNQFQFTVDGLAPETNYTVWMEVYLINGKVRASNNMTVITRAGSPISKTTEKEKLEAVGEVGGSGDVGVTGTTYYAGMVVAAVVATLSTVGFVVLLVVLLRKQSSAKAPITSPKSHSAYDNPTYKDSLE